jgi:hypothetical protein
VPAALYTQEDSWNSFLLEAESIPGALCGWKFIEKSNDLIGNRTRDLPACSTVPQPKTLLRAVAETPTASSLLILPKLALTVTISRHFPNLQLFYS